MVALSPAGADHSRLKRIHVQVSNKNCAIMADLSFHFRYCLRKCSAFERLTVGVPIELAWKMNGCENDACITGN